MTHKMRLREIYFNKIKNGEKIFEIRLNDEKRKQINVGDNFEFVLVDDENKRIYTLVKDLIIFKSFEKMASTLHSKDIGFEGLTKEKNSRCISQILFCRRREKVWCPCDKH